MPGILAKLERIPEITTRLDLIDTLRAHALSLEPLDGVETMALSDYDRDWLVRYTYNSNAIEGSTLTLQDTSLVLEGEFVPSDSPARFVVRGARRRRRHGLRPRIRLERRELEPGTDPKDPRGDRIGPAAVRTRHVPSLRISGENHRDPRQDRRPVGDP